MDKSSPIKFQLTKRKGIILGTIIAMMVLFLFWPLPKNVVVKPFSTVLLDEEAELLGAVLAEDEIWRFPTVDSLPYRYKTALITYEDAYFYQHPGINPVSILKALIDNIQAGKVVRGGSTLTMQLARMADGNQKRTLLQKITELGMALRYEAQLSKEEILHLYATHAPFGSNIEGISAASYRYFGRAPHALSWAEAALLAVLPNQPSMIFPGRNTDRLKEKRDQLLYKLWQANEMDSISYSLSLLEGIPQKQQIFPKNSQHFLFSLHQKEGGKAYISTINGKMQNRTHELLNQYVQKLKASEIHNACALIIDYRKQEVKAYIGNAETGTAHDESVDIIQSVRSPGSLLKPFLYQFALEEGVISPQQLLKDIPLFYEGFSPKNFDHKYYGAVKADDALARSLNIPFVNLLRSYGVSPFYDRLKSAGFNNLQFAPSHYGLSLILGGAEISPMEVASLYAKMALSIQEDSSYKEPQILKEEIPVKSLLPFDPAASYLTLKAMKEVQRPGEEYGWERFTSSKEVAWKTGTSFGFRDAWAVGLDHQYVVLVWTGNADGEGRPGLIGVRTAAPLMFQLMELLNGGEGDFLMPVEEMKTAVICQESGYIASDVCPERKRQFVNKSKQLRESCPYHKAIFIDKSSKLRVNGDCFPLSKAEKAIVFDLPPAVAYYYKSYHADFEAMPAWKASCGMMNENPMQLIYPQDIRSIFIPRELDGKEGRAIFELAHSNADAKVYWYVDDQYVGQTEEEHQLAISQLEAGEHQLYVVDDEANYLRLSFFVLAREE